MGAFPGKYFERFEALKKGFHAEVSFRSKVIRTGSSFAWMLAQMLSFDMTHETDFSWQMASFILLFREVPMDTLRHPKVSTTGVLP